MSSLLEFQKLLARAKELGIKVIVNSDETISLYTENLAFGGFSHVSDALVFLKGIEHGMKLANQPKESIED
jgi:hypothetical protein